MRKRTAQKDTIFTDSQVNSNFPYRWSPASLTFNIYFYLFFFYLYMTRKTINNNTLHLKSPKNQHRGVVLGRPAMKLLGGGGGGATSFRRPTLALGSVSVHQTNNYTTTQKSYHSKHNTSIFTNFLFLF